MARMRFQHYAWGLLAYTLLVVLGGAYVRATFSGDGCGSHWPDCQGQLIPPAGELKTLIEFGHRASTGVLGFLVLGLLVWAFRAFPAGHPARGGAVSILLWTLAEALVGAVLVRYRLVAEDRSVYRAVAMPTHLIVTFQLLASMALTAWWAGGAPRLRWRGQGTMGWSMGLALAAMVILGVTGAITALGDTLFPARSVDELFYRDPAGPRHFLITLRFYHPLVALSVGLYLVLTAGLAMQLRPSALTQSSGRAVLILLLVQLGAGALNWLLRAPVWMQLIHLLLADLLWISLVLLAASALAEGVPQAESSPSPLPSPIDVGSRPTPPLPHLPSPAPPATWRDYLALTKPRVISLLLLTTLAAMGIASGGEGPGVSGWVYLAVGLGLYMAAGAANAINMVLERDLDLLMGRTASRPTVTQSVPARAALQFAFALMVGSFALLWGAANLLSAMLALAGLAFYVIVYTLLLKRRTWYNIVIGGAAGAFPPLVGWAAVTGDLSPLAWCLFGIIFLWTPVHFWALALMIKEDYARAGVPMLPVVRGDRATVAQIGYYALLTAGISAVPLLLAEGGKAPVGGLYLAAAVVLNVVLLWQSLKLYQRPDRPRAKSLFKYSMVYLALLFLAMVVDRAPWVPRAMAAEGRPQSPSRSGGVAKWRSTEVPGPTGPTPPLGHSATPPPRPSSEGSR